MKTNEPLIARAAGWSKTLLLAPLLAFSFSVFAQEAPKPAPAKPAVKAPAAKPPTAVAPGKVTAPAVAPGRATTPTPPPGRGTTPVPGPGRPGGGGVSAAPPKAVPGRVEPPRVTKLPGGGEAHFDQRGKMTDLHKPGMDIHHGPDGRRDIRVERPDGSRVFARGRDGYVQGRYNFGGREYAHRTYFEHGRAYDRFYNRYPYHGVYLEGYAPARYYAPAYYSWAYAPWGAPVPYAWGFAGNPWAVYYGGYFTPYPVYPSPAFWLTDYMISTSLQADYQARLDAANGVAPQAFAAPPTPLTPEVKQAIAAEVQRQIALENSEAQQVAQNAQPDPTSSGVVRMLIDNTTHAFVAGTSLEVTDAGGQQCALSQGDVMQLNPAPLPPTATAANLVVLASKPQECLKGDTVSVPLADLQDMQNHMRESIDTGLSEMQGAKGLPPIPQSARLAPTTAAFAVSAPPPDPTAAAQIAQQVQEADKAEKELANQGAPPAIAPPAPPPAEPKEPKIGMTVAEIEGIFNKPYAQFTIGPKTTYSYKDLGFKLVFTDGKVTAITPIN